jgi:hypothetical protein
MTRSTIETWLDEWLEARRETVAGPTLGKYKQVRNDFLRSLGARKDNRLDSITPLDFIRFRDSLLKEGRAPQAVEQSR